MRKKFKFCAIKLSGIMILIFIAQILLSGFTDFFVLNQSSYSEPWRFLSAVFLHGGLAHLVYNLFALVLFGSILESLISSKKFLIVFFVTGILANLFSVNFYSSSLGASGAIMGVIGALVVVRPWMFVWAFGLPMPMIVAGALWAVGDIIGVFMPSNVGNIAHLSGMFFGLILGALYAKKKKRAKRKKIVIDERSIRQWEDGFLR
tara:strand:- start:18 stop:632 length:615 start_codon:yes stop_codon:yes gene_type:complete